MLTYLPKGSVLINYDADHDVMVVKFKNSQNTYIDDNINNSEISLIKDMKTNCVIGFQCIYYRRLSRELKLSNMLSTYFNVNVPLLPIQPLRDFEV